MLHPIIGLSPNQPASVCAALTKTGHAQLGQDYANACARLNELSAALMQRHALSDDERDFAEVLDSNEAFVQARTLKSSLWAQISKLQQAQLDKLAIK